MFFNLALTFYLQAIKTTLEVYHRKKAEGGVFAFIYNFVGNI